MIRSVSEYQINVVLFAFCSIEAVAHPKVSRGLDTAWSLKNTSWSLKHRVFLGVVSSVCMFTFVMQLVYELYLVGIPRAYELWLQVVFVCARVFWMKVLINRLNLCFMSEGAPNNELEASSAGTVGANDLLIVGPGVLGRIIAEEWRKVITEECTKYNSWRVHQIYDGYSSLLHLTRYDWSSRAVSLGSNFHLGSKVFNCNCTHTESLATGCCLCLPAYSNGAFAFTLSLTHCVCHNYFFSEGAWMLQEHPGSQIYGQTLTSNHHEELIKLEITPSLKGTQATHKFPYIIFSAPSYGNADYPGEVRYA